MTSAQLVPALVVPFIAWRVYARLKRTVGRQPFRPNRLIARAVVFFIFTALIAWAGSDHPQALGGLAGGVVAGAALAMLGLKLTRFDLTPEGEFYIPNTAIGVGLSFLLVARVLYRIIALSILPPVAGTPMPGMFDSPLTLAVFGLSAGYFIAYNIGLVLKGKTVARHG